MNQNKLSFESENLVVDWIGFNIQGLLDRKQVKQIAKYLFQNFGFNSTLAAGSDEKEEILFNDSKNKYQVFFRIYKYSDIYWDGIKIDFSGHNGHQFYKVIVANQVNWKVFNHQKDIRLSHLDLCYSSKKTNFESFLKQCYDKVARNKAIKNISLQQNFLSWIFKIGKRGSPNYYRVYQNQTQIRFELEQRGLVKHVPVIGNAAICTDSICTTGRAGINFYCSPSPVAKIFFGLSCACGIFGAASSGTALITLFAGIPVAGWVGSMGARSFNRLGKYTLHMRNVTSGNLTNATAISELMR